MKSIATLGPEGSSSWQAAKQFNPDDEIKLYPNTSSVIKAFTEKDFPEPRPPLTIKYLLSLSTIGIYFFFTLINELY